MTTPLRESDRIPPNSTLRPRHPWQVAVLANIKERGKPLPADVPPEAEADYDYMETVDSIRAVVETHGHQTVFIPANRDLPYALKEVRPDICFNIAEGLGGDSREAQVPGLLELLKIPYTGSRLLANAIALDRTLTKRLWRDRHLPTAPFQEFTFGDEPLRPEMRFPLFVKASRESIGTGVDEEAVVNNEAELRERTEYVIRLYHQPALAEIFLPGREFSAGILGRFDTALYSRHPEWYEKDGFLRLPLLEPGTSQSTTPGITVLEAGAQSVGTEEAPRHFCPASLDPELTAKLQRLAWRAHIIVGALDVSRVDIRLDAEGQPQLAEINPLPGLTPHSSHLCTMADSQGISYEDLILEILYLGASRWKMLAPRPDPALPKKKIDAANAANKPANGK
jgi:D-alanine-D-alanine ligase